MAEKTKEVVNSTLTKTQARVMMAICTALELEASDKKLIAKRDGEKIKGPTANLSDAEGTILLKADGVDIPKVCRQLHREDLVIYGWNDDRSRYVGITEEGFKQLQLPVRERTFPEKKEGEAKAPKEKKTKAQKAEGNLAAEPNAEDEGPEMPVVKPNPLMKNFIVTYGGKKKIHKAKDQADFDELKKRTAEDWIPLFA